MKKYLLKSLFFLIPVLLVWMVAEIFYRTAENNYTYKTEKIQEGKDEIKGLIFGNSHTFFGLNPAYFQQNVFNLANVSQNIYFDQLLFEKYVDELPNLEFIVLSVEYSSLSQQDNTSEDVWRKYFYEAQMDLDVPIVSDFNPRKYSLALTRRFNVTKDYFKTYLEEGTLVTADEKGWATNYEGQIDYSIEKLGEIVAAKHEDGLLDFSKNEKRLQEIIQMCKKRGIKVLIVNMPVTKAYFSHINKEKWYKITQICQKLAEEHQNVVYLPLFKNEKFELSDFYDADHLNHSGAEKASGIVNQELFLMQNFLKQKN